MQSQTDLDRLVVDQRVYCNSSSFVISSIGLFAELRPPRSCQNCKRCVAHHSDSGDGSKFGTILVRLESGQSRAGSKPSFSSHQYTTDHGYLQSSR